MKNISTIIYTADKVSMLYDELCDAAINVRDVMRKKFLMNARASYENACKDKGTFFSRKTPFSGTYEEYLEKEYSEEYLDKFISWNCESASRLRRLIDFVGDAVASNLDVHLTLNDHRFYKICLTEKSNWINIANANYH